MELVFLDTLKHAGRGPDDVHLDLVRFSNAQTVTVREIRVIASGRQVRLNDASIVNGFTAPSAFTLDVFLSNVRRPTNATMQRIGTFAVDKGAENRFTPELLVPTDGLVFRGPFTQLTLAIFADPSPHVLGNSALQALAAPICLPPPPAPPVTNISGPRLGFNLSVPPPTLLHFDPTRPPPPVLLAPPTVLAPPQQISPVPPRPRFDRRSASPQRPRKRSRRDSDPKKKTARGNEPSPPPAAEQPISSDEGEAEESLEAISDEEIQFPCAEEKTEAKTSSRRHRSRDRPGSRSSSETSSSRRQDSRRSSSRGETRRRRSSRRSEGEANVSRPSISEPMEVVEEIEATEEEEKMLASAAAQFNPLELQWRPLKKRPAPWLGPVEVASLRLDPLPANADLPDAVQLLLKTVSSMGSSYEESSAAWLESMETLLPSLEEALAFAASPGALDLFGGASKWAECVEALTSWTMFGLDMAEAATQPAPAPIIRHLKAGLRLATLLGTATEGLSRALVDAEIQHLLMDLLGEEHMTQPMKLAVLRAVHATLAFPAAATTFVAQARPAWQGGPLLSPFQRLVKLLRHQPIRVRAATAVILRHVALVEGMESLRDACAGLAASASTDDRELRKDESALLPTLQALLRAARHPQEYLGFPRASLPVSRFHSLRASSGDARPRLFRLLRHFRLGSGLLVLCGLGRWRLSALARRLARALARSPGGLAFLLCEGAASAALVAGLAEEEEAGEAELGGELAAYAEAALGIDQVADCGEGSAASRDSQALTSAFQRLHILSATSIGRRAIADVFSWEDNLALLTQLVLVPDDDPEEGKALRKSVGAAYAMEFLLLTLLHASDVVPTLRRHAAQLRRLAQSSADSSSKATELRLWLGSLDQLASFGKDSEDVEALVETLSERLKAGVTALASAPSPRVPGGLILDLRLLCSFSIAPQIDPAIEHTVELKFQAALIDAYAHGVYQPLIRLISMLCEGQSVAWALGLSGGRDGAAFTAALVPALRIISRLLRSLLAVRGNEFADFGVVPPMVSAFAICCSMGTPQSAEAPHAEECAAVHDLVLDALLAFTQLPLPALPPVPEEGQDEDDRSKAPKSAWTGMLDAVLSTTLASPANFAGGVGLLSELLPLPLPLPPGQAEAAAALALRETWESALWRSREGLGSLLRSLAPSPSAGLASPLRRLCLQTADLSRRLAGLVLGVVVDADSFALAAQLVAAPPLKAALLHQLRVPNAESTPAINFFERMLSSLTSPAHVEGQETIIGLLGCLVDWEVGLAPVPAPPDPAAFTNVIMGPALRSTCSALLGHLSWGERPAAGLLPALRVLSLLAEHDVGLCALQSALTEAAVPPFRALMEALCDGGLGESDFLSTLSTATELLRSLRRRPAPAAVLGASVVCAALGWEGQTDDHPMIRIRRRLKDKAMEDESMRNYVESLDELINILAEGDEAGANVVKEGSLHCSSGPGQLSLEAQWRARVVAEAAGEEEDSEYRLGESFWFPTATDDDDDAAAVATDLEALRQEFLPHFDPKEERHPHGSSAPRPRTSESGEQPGIINTAKGASENQRTPLRGRGFNVGRGSGGPRGASDHFRSRPQNTSRAPSMHVDDFLMAEIRAKGSGGGAGSLPSSSTGSMGAKSKFSRSGPSRGSPAAPRPRRQSPPDRFSSYSAAWGPPARPDFDDWESGRDVPPPRRDAYSMDRNRHFDPRRRQPSRLRSGGGGAGGGPFGRRRGGQLRRPNRP